MGGAFCTLCADKEEKETPGSQEKGSKLLMLSVRKQKFSHSEWEKKSKVKGTLSGSRWEGSPAVFWEVRPPISRGGGVQRAFAEKRDHINEYEVRI